MKTFKRALAVFASLLLVASCSKASEGENQASEASDTQGTVSFIPSVQSTVSEVTRSEKTYSIPTDLLPTTGEITMEIEGDYNSGPLLVSEYQASLPYMEEGTNYKISLSYGDATAEGATAVYFTGESTFEVVARASRTKEVSVALANSIVCLDVDQMFSDYYTDATFTVTTSAGNSFDFTPGDDNIVFVEAGTSLSLSGTATKVSNGVSVIFNTSTIGSTEKCTLSRINIEAKSIGGITIEITTDDTITSAGEAGDTSTELNPLN